MNISFGEIGLILLGLLPSFIYLSYYEKTREKELKAHPFGGWYFIFEFFLSFCVGLIPIALALVIIYPDSWMAAEKIPHKIGVISATFVFFFIIQWGRTTGPSLPLKISSFVPFLHEIMGKKPEYEPGNSSSETAVKPTGLFIGCSVSLLIVTAAVIAAVGVWAAK